jgi:hypothetical protein
MDTKDLEQSLDALILSLGDNKAAENYYQQVKVKVGNTKRPNDLIRLLEALCSSAKVKDVHGLDNIQCEKWDSMWVEANKLRLTQNP